MKRLALCLTVILFQQLGAQDWGNLLKKTLADTGTKEKEKMDSLDFQFAISINENAGFSMCSKRAKASLKDSTLSRSKARKVNPKLPAIHSNMP
jgi:hypothetical protein